MNSSILFMAPMKKMSLNWVIGMVMRVHRKMGEHMEWQRDTEPEDRSQEALGTRGGEEQQLHQPVVKAKICMFNSNPVVICQKAWSLW